MALHEQLTEQAELELSIVRADQLAKKESPEDPNPRTVEQQLTKDNRTVAKLLLSKDSPIAS